jgi:hypothetical protein
MHALAPNPDNVTACNGLWYTTSSANAPDTQPWTHTSTDLRNEADWINAWTTIAQRYLNNRVVIGADLVNEPYNATWGDGNPNSDLCGAHTRCGNAILAVNPNWLIFCEGIYETLNFGQNNGGWVGVQWDEGLDLAQMTPVRLNVANQVVYSPHEYGPGLGNWNYFNAPDFPNNMTTVWNQMFGFQVKNNAAPVMFGEIGDMLVAGANNGYETPQKFAQAQQWINLLMQYVSGRTSTGGTPDVPAGSAGFSWNWFCWSTNGYSGTPGSITNTNLLMGDYNTVNTNVLQYITPYLAPLMLTNVPVTVTIELSEPAPGALSVGWATHDGTAIAGTHYVAASGTVSFAPGQSLATMVVYLKPITASAPGSLYFMIRPTPGSGYGVRNGTGTVTINYG